MDQLLPLMPLSPAEAMRVLNMRETLRGERARPVESLESNDDGAVDKVAARPTDGRRGLQMMTARGEDLAASLGKLEGEFRQTLLAAAPKPRGARCVGVASFADELAAWQPQKRCLKRRGSTWAGAAPMGKPLLPAAALRRRNTLHSISAIAADDESAPRSATASAIGWL